MKPFADHEIRALLVLVGVVLLSCGVWLIQQFHPTLFMGDPVVVVDPVDEAPAQIVVHVVGEVQRPGLVHLPRGARVYEAIAAAGGVTPEADLELLNQAAVLVDGRQLRVPRRAEALTPGVPTASASTSSQASIVSPIPLNTATQAQLEQIPGIGPAMAGRILEYRQRHGGFSSLEELENVRGIGPKTLAKLREWVVVY